MRTTTVVHPPEVLQLWRRLSCRFAGEPGLVARHREVRVLGTHSRIAGGNVESSACDSGAFLWPGCLPNVQCVTAGVDRGAGPSSTHQIADPAPARASAGGAAFGAVVDLDLLAAHLATDGLFFPDDLGAQADSFDGLRLGGHDRALGSATCGASLTGGLVVGDHDPVPAELVMVPAGPAHSAPCRLIGGKLGRVRVHMAARQTPRWHCDLRGRSWPGRALRRRTRAPV